MIAFAREYHEEQPATPAWHEGFLKLLPAIREQLRFSLRRLPPEERAEAMAECIASIAVEYVKLHAHGKEGVAFASSLASYAVRRYFFGRRVASPLNGDDVSSPYAQRKRGFQVKSLDRRRSSGEWLEVLVEDRRSTPADVAASRIDLHDWFGGMPALKRRVAQTLATGESGKETARLCNVTPGRVSQLRGELANDWAEFQGEAIAVG